MLAQGHSNVKIPVLVTHGDKDSLTSFDVSKALIKKISSQDKTFQEYPGYFHERKVYYYSIFTVFFTGSMFFMVTVHNEVGKEQIIELYCNWILHRAVPKAKL